MQTLKRRQFRFILISHCYGAIEICGWEKSKKKTKAIFPSFVAFPTKTGQ